MRTIDHRNLYMWIVSLLLGAGLVEAQQMYYLGTLGGSGSGVSAINNRSQVVGCSRTLGDQSQHAFLWTPGATDGVPSNPQMKDLGKLGAGNSCGLAINDSGQVAGVSGYDEFFLWTPGGTDGVPGNPQMKDLGRLPIPAWARIQQETRLMGMNAKGQVVGYTVFGDNGVTVFRGFLWTPGATDGLPGNPELKDLGTLGGASCEAEAINDSGQVTGWSTNANGYQDAFLWTPGGTDGVAGNPQMRDLGTSGSEGEAINALGQVAGFYSWNVAFLWTPQTEHLFDWGVVEPSGYYPVLINDSGQVATTDFLWTPRATDGVSYNPEMKVLGGLGGAPAVAAAMNNRGQVVGTANVPGNRAQHPFLWTPGGIDGVPGNPQMKDLDPLETVPSSTDWAVAINDSGQVVGYDQTGAFLYLPASDNTKPVSQVSPLPTDKNVANFVVQWSGTDTGGSGIHDFTIYSSEDGGPFTVWLLQTTASHSTFPGTAGHSYGFYSIARSNAKNQEDAKTGAEATTYVASAGIGDVNGDGQVNCLDIEIVKASFGKSKGHAGFDPRADVNHDGIVNILDLAIVSQQLVPGTKCP